MMNIHDLLKVDKDSLPYLDGHDIKVERFTFNELGKAYREKRSFYKIEGIDDYIIKDTTMVPLVFNRTINKRLLRNLIDKQEELPKIDFPIGYYKVHGLMNGTIIRNYEGAKSIRQLIYLEKFDDIKKYYDHCSDPIDNFINMLLDILELLTKLQGSGIYYTDVNTGNFVIYNNGIKIIDFDPGFVFFKDRNFARYDRVLRNYACLVDVICQRLGFKKVLFNSEDTFTDTARRVKCLRRELER